MSETENNPTKVAIACQGGGSHTAFTAGVLQELLESWDHDHHELVGISGTSGGAFNALTAWYGLMRDDEAYAIELLETLWDDLAANGVIDRVTNDWLVGWSRIENSGFPMPQLTPYMNPGSRWGQNQIKQTLERHIDFEAIPTFCRQGAPELVVGTVDVNGGEFETFVNEEVTAEAVLASSAVPNLFEGVELHGHLHWDGLFSQNPPIDDLLTTEAGRKPEELWIIQINPQKREGIPTTIEEIADRRNELAGNLSLNQELRFIERVNHWIDEGHLSGEQFTRTEVRRIGLDKAYHCSTKLDRSPDFIGELKALGTERAAAFAENH